MKKAILAVLVICIGLTLTSCGGHGDRRPPVILAQILSDPAFDGTITQDPRTGSFTVSQGMTPTIQSVFAGLDPINGTESRAFLDFPLTGPGGVPGDAIIASAILDIVINSIAVQQFSGTIPIRIDLVSFQPPDLVITDFNRSILPSLLTATISPPISHTDIGNHVYLDVTSMMNEVQRLGLPDFQIRILEDLGPVSPGLIEINDTTGAFQSELAPLLQVRYY